MGECIFVLPEIERYIDEMGGYEEWKKKCLAEEIKWLEKIDKNIDNLPINNPTPIDIDNITKESLLHILRDENRKYWSFFFSGGVGSALRFRQKLITFIQLYLLDEVESETEDTDEVIFRALKNYVKLKEKMKESD
jgi:hypothetical protein